MQQEQVELIQLTQRELLTSLDPAVKHRPLVTTPLNVAVFSGIRQLRYDIEIIRVAEARAH